MRRSCDAFARFEPSLAGAPPPRDRTIRCCTPAQMYSVHDSLSAPFIRTIDLTRFSGQFAINEGGRNTTLNEQRRTAAMIPRAIVIR